ncbi:MAG: alpha/beta hydrolase [Candidatus Omnitrophota bacterium]
MSLFFKKRAYQKNLIPTPDLYLDPLNNPFQHTDKREKEPSVEVFFATERQRDVASSVGFYISKRDSSLHLGKASVRIGPAGITWEDVLTQSLKEKRDRQLSLEVTGVQEFGDLATILPESQLNDSFTEDINQKLQRSKQKDIFVFVPGFKVPFEDPILVVRELWHYLGYDGIFLAYSWPSTSGRVTIYAHDVETTHYCVRNFRILLDYLAQSTCAEKIHIIGHSAGTRIVCAALNELRLIHSKENEAHLRKSLKIGHVILMGGDFDRMVLKSYYRDHILDILERVTFYVSRKDWVLKIARILFKTPRVGETSSKDLSENALKVLRQESKIQIIDATSAQGSHKEGGHCYLFTSSTISSDLILLLKHNLNPQERHLKPKEEELYWEFPKKRKRLSDKSN